MWVARDWRAGKEGGRTQASGRGWQAQMQAQNVAARRTGYQRRTPQELAGCCCLVAARRTSGRLARREVRERAHARSGAAGWCSAAVHVNAAKHASTVQRQCAPETCN